jgi:hypothetical protein
MRARPLTTTLVGAVAAVALLSGLTACSTTGGGNPVASDANVSGAPLDPKTEMTNLCTQMITEALPVEAAQALAEASGYVVRMGTVDGEAQAQTKDIQEDRFTLDVTGGIVTGCTVG